MDADYRRTEEITMRVGLTAGTFDLFHAGHINILKKCREQCDELIVMVSSDTFNNIKGKDAHEKFELRALQVSNNCSVNYVVMENGWEDKGIYIELFDVDVFFMGDDWDGKFDDLPCEVVYFPRTPGISSTQLRNKLK